MHTCPTCKGTKKIQSTITKYGSSDPPEHFECKCITCVGTGTLTSNELAAYNRMMEMWCQCEGDTPVEYFRDGEHPDRYRHHHRCKICKKIVQTG